MAERTKFSAYCVYSAVISLVIYPIEAHWIWGGGWLSKLGFHDYAGSCAIHMVGGIAALIGAAATSPSELSSIFLTTTIAPSVATCTTMFYTWCKNGKPDVLKFLT